MKINKTELYGEIIFILLIALFLTSCTTRHYPPSPKWKGYQLVFEERKVF